MGDGGPKSSSIYEIIAMMASSLPVVVWQEARTMKMVFGLRLRSQFRLRLNEKLFSGYDARIEARNSKIEARLSSV